MAGAEIRGVGVRLQVDEIVEMLEDVPQLFELLLWIFHRRIIPHDTEKGV